VRTGYTDTPGYSWGKAASIGLLGVRWSTRLRPWGGARIRSFLVGCPVFVVPGCGGLRSHGHGKLSFVSGASKLMMSKPAQRVVCAGAAGALGAVMLTGVVQIPAQAALSSPVDLLTQANITLDGAAENDRSGSSVAGAGDVNGDGKADVIIGAPRADPNGSNSGSSYVVYGSGTPTDIDLNYLGAAGFRIDGAAANDRSGSSVAGAGDVNGDGKADVIIGAPNADNNSRTNSGSSYVVYGSATPTDIDLLNPLGVAGFRIDGAAADDNSGSSVAGAGDVNGDGKADVIIGAWSAGNNGRDGSGSSYVVYGSAAPTNIDLFNSLGVAGFRIDGAAADDRSGASVAGAGDVNGDGKADVIIGAPTAGNNGRTNSGSSYVVYGSASPTTVDLNSLGAAGFRIDGAAEYNFSGSLVAGAGDVNGDGKADVIIGAPTAGNNGRDFSGSSYVVYGSAAPTNIDLFNSLGAAGFRIDGAAEYNLSGSSVAGAGDVNGDGKADVIIGAPDASNNGRDNSGSSYVVYGSATPTDIDLLNPLGAAGFRIDGAAANDRSGSSVAGAGDVNGDGGADVIIGAPLADNNGRNNSGSSYVVYGDPPPVPPAGKLPQSQKGISKTLPTKGKKVVNKKNARTKQGQKMTAKISRVSSKTLATRGDISCYKVKKGPKRKLVIKTNGQCANIKIWVTYKAPGNATYEKYRNTITFKTKR